MRGLPSLCDQGYVSYGIWAFLTVVGLFWAQKQGLYTDLGLGLFFGKITSPNDDKIAFVQIYSTTDARMTGIGGCYKQVIKIVLCT